jgi:hypothetical protein
MIAWFAGVLASRLAAPIALGAAALLALALTVQTVRLDGVHIFGWKIVAGALDENAALAKSIDDPTTGFRARLAQTAANFNTCTAKLGEQNAAVDRLGAESVRLTQLASAAIASARVNGVKLATTAAAILAKKPPAKDFCPAADALILESLHK